MFLAVASVEMRACPLRFALMLRMRGVLGMRWESNGDIHFLCVYDDDVVLFRRTAIRDTIT